MIEPVRYVSTMMEFDKENKNKRTYPSYSKPVTVGTQSFPDILDREINKLKGGKNVN